MMEPIQNTFSLVAEDRLGDQDDVHAIYTHSLRSRYLVLTVLGTYLVIFTYFTNFALDSVLELNQLPDAFMLSGDFEWTRWMRYLIGGIGWFFALVILMYFLFAFVDIWGLQVCASRHEIRVQNTIIGQSLKRWTGVGRIAMDDIVEIQPKSMMTYLRSDHHHLRFSPVDRLENLISTIILHARHAKINE